MILDANLAFTGFGTSGYAPTTATQDNLAPNTIDTAPLGLPSPSGGSSTPGYNAGASVNAGRDLGVGTEFWWQVLVTVAVTSASTATINFVLVTDATATLASVAYATGVGVLLASPAIAKANLTAGTYFRAQLPAGLNYLEFLGLDVYINTTNLSAGTFESELLPNIQQSDLYLSGFAVV